MRTPEQRVYDAFGAKLPHTWFYRRVEALTDKGMPDLYICHHKRAFWIELKSDTRIVRKEQYAWHRAHGMAGGTTYVVNRTKAGVWELLRIVGDEPVRAGGLEAYYLVQAGNLEAIIHHLSQ